MTLDINGTNVFKRNYKAFNNSLVRFIINQGGTRSGKSYAIMQILIIKALEKKRTINVIRSSTSSLQDTAIDDMKNILLSLELFIESNYNKTTSKYRFDNGSTINYLSPEKGLKGRKCDIAYLNEADSLSQADFIDINVRMEGDMKLFIDFNPSDTEHWIYDLIAREQTKVAFIKSTYKDNIYLRPEQVEEIENLCNVDEEYYKSYALGERPVSNSRVYRHFNKCVEVYGDLICYGLDCGMGHPTALVSMYREDNKYYFNEEIYRTQLTAEDLVVLMNELSISKDVKIYSDHQPYVTEPLRRAGFKVENANKDFRAGINTVKSSQIFITNHSKGIWTEYKQYSWKTKGTIISDEIIKLHDDALDALRYAIHTNRERSKVTPIKVYSSQRRNNGY
jgi:phage terminase large subunit